MVGFIIFALLLAGIMFFIWGLASLGNPQTDDDGEFCLKLSLIFCIVAVILGIIFK